MATKPKTRIGTVPCLVCGIENAARINEAGTLDMGCGYCDFTGYVKKGTEAYDKIMATVKMKAPPPGAPPQPSASVATVAPSAEGSTAATPAPGQIVPPPLSFVELMAGGRKV